MTVTKKCIYDDCAEEFIGKDMIEANRKSMDHSKTKHDMNVKVEDSQREYAWEIHEHELRIQQKQIEMLTNMQRLSTELENQHGRKKDEVSNVKKLYRIFFNLALSKK